MAHTLAFPGQRQARWHGQSLDGTRIAATAGAIAINILALLLLLAPVTLPPPAPPVDRAPDVTWIRPRTEPQPLPVPVPVTAQPRQPQPTRTTPPRAATAPIPRPVIDSRPGDEAAPAIEPAADVDPGDASELTPPLASGSQLQTISAPSPAYPPAAIRGGLTGTVELEILVGTDGRPLEVRIVRSSGHHLLDQAARKIVLSQWRFHPAIRDGRPVQALGRVPIAFTLDR